MLFRSRNPIAYRLGEAWVCSYPDIRDCGAGPKQLKPSSSDVQLVGADQSLTSALSGGMFSEKQMEQRKIFVQMGHAREAMMTDLTLNLLRRRAQGETAMSVYTEFDFQELKNRIGGAFFPFFYSLGENLPYILSGYFAVACLTVTLGLLGRMYLAYKLGGCGIWILGSFFHMVFALLALPIEVIRATWSSAMREADPPSDFPVRRPPNRGGKPRGGGNKGGRSQGRRNALRPLEEGWDSDDSTTGLKLRPQWESSDSADKPRRASDSDVLPTYAEVRRNRPRIAPKPSTAPPPPLPSRAGTPNTLVQEDDPPAHVPQNSYPRYPNLPTLRLPTFAKLIRNRPCCDPPTACCGVQEMDTVDPTRDTDSNRLPPFPVARTPTPPPIPLGEDPPVGGGSQPRPYNTRSSGQFRRQERVDDEAVDRNHSHSFLH